MFLRSASLVRISVGLLLAVAGWGSAQDDALYAPAPPPGAAFVRIANSLPTRIASPVVGDTVYDAIDAFAVSPYHVVDRGEAGFDVGAQTREVTVEPGTYYTIVHHENGPVVFVDVSRENRARARLDFYNISGRVLSFRTADGGTSVFEGVQPMDRASIDVNPVDLAFGIFDGERMVMTTDGLRLARGRAVAVFVFEASDGLRAFVVTAETR